MTPIVFVQLLMFMPFVAMMAARMLLSLFALELGASAFEVGLLAAANQVFALFFAYAVGVVQDRYGARGLFVIGAFAGAAGFLLPFLYPVMPALYLASFLFGVWAIAMIVPVQSLIGVLSTPDRVARDMGYFTGIAWGTALFGPVLGGFVIDRFGHALGSLVLMPLPALTLALLLVWGGLLPRGRASAKSTLRLRGVLADPEIRWIFVLSGLVQLAMELFPFFLPLFGHALGLSASSIGGLLALSAIAAIPLALALPKLAARSSETELLAWSFGVAAVSYLMLPMFDSVVLLAAASLLFGLGMGCGQALVNLLMYKRSPKEVAGTLMGLRMMGNTAVRLIGPTAFGALASAAGLASAPLAAAGVLSWAGWWAARRARRPA